MFTLFQLLLRKKAAEELKKEQERKAAERRRIIEERCGKPKLIDEANEGRVLPVFSLYHIFKFYGILCLKPSIFCYVDGVVNAVSQKGGKYWELIGVR